MAKNANHLHTERLSRTDRVALWITEHVGTFYFFLFCNLLAGTVLFVHNETVIATVQFVSSAWLQLILLPLLQIGQNIQSKHAETRAELDYEVNVKAEKEIEDIQLKLTSIIRLLGNDRTKRPRLASRTARRR